MTLIMGLFGVAFIFLTVGYVAWEQRDRLIQRNEDDIRSNAFFLADHAARLLEVTDLTLKQTSASIEGQSWDQIGASRPLWLQLRAIRQALPYIDNIWLNDPSGRLRLTSAGFPTPSSDASDRDAFSAQAVADQGLFVGEPIIGRVTKEPTFMISRRLQDRDGSFNGIVSVTVTLSYFNSYWGTLRLPKGSRITLLRSTDTTIIAQYPPPVGSLSFVQVDKEAFGQAVLSHAQSGIYEFMGTGGERLGAYHRIGDQPLYIHVSIPRDAYWQPWFVQTRLYGAFALIALIALLALTALAARQFREEATTAALLERQVALRTSELRAETSALEVLNRTGSALAGNLDLDQIIENVVDAGVQLTGARVGAFFHADEMARGEPGSDQPCYAHYAPDGTREALSSFPMIRLVAPAFAEGKTIRSDDVLTDNRYGRKAICDGVPLDRVPVRSVLAVPILSRVGEFHGVLLFGHEKPAVFTERAERLITGLAAQAAIALENGRLYRDAQREIEERKQVQAQQSLLIRELHHRVKNTLATVQAIVGATARSATNIDAFYKAFVGRIVSLANTHSLLTEAVWQTASLRHILEKELSPYNDDKGERVALEGPVVELPSEAAVPIGMAVHELTTNAAKYGALSVSNGRVVVRWDAEAESEGVRLRLTWKEEGGPRVSAPARQGFGSRLLHRLLAAQLNARVETEFEATGVRVSVEALLKPTPLLDPVG